MDQRDKLWLEFKRNRSDSAREHLICEYAYLAKYAVDRLGLFPSGTLNYDDLIGDAVVGLIDAVDKFDPGRGVKFETYALARVQGEVIDVIRQLDWTPRSVRKHETTLRDTYAKLEQELERPPTDGEVARHLGIDVDELEKMLADIGQSALLSLDDVIASGKDILASASEGEGEDPASHAQRSEQKRLLAKSIDELPERERTVVALYYYEDLTQKEIARALGVTESRVCQIHTKAVLKLSGKLSRSSARFALAA